MNEPRRQLRFYTGCETNKGVFVGFDHDSVFIQASPSGPPTTYSQSAWGKELFLLLRPMSTLTDAERYELIAKGCNIGRPKGYSFSVEAFLYLLDLRMDIFGLVRAGYAQPARVIGPAL